MKSLILAIVLTLAIPSLAAAQGLINIYCDECRDLTEFPEDARNFSYNQVFGSRSWLTMDQADRFLITDNHGNIVTIDMNIDYQVNLFSSRLFDFGDVGKLFVEGFVVQIRVIYYNLDIVTYMFTRRDVSGDLPVGQSNTRRRSSGNGGGADGYDGDDGFNDAGDYEYDDGDSYEEEDDVTECEECTLQPIRPDGSLGDEVDMPTEEDWEYMQEL